MNPNPVLPLVALALASACAASTQAPAGAARPAFSAYRVGATHPVALTASYGGYLTQQGSCLGLTIDGRFATIIWPETARLGLDRNGLWLGETGSGVKLRPGDYLIGTGGPAAGGRT